MIRLYVDLPLLKGQAVPLSDSQAHYLQKVMRLREGETVLLFNGVQGEWSAVLETVTKKICLLVPSHQTRPQVPADELWLLFSPLKPKSQLFLEEKATELGVGTLCPIQCTHTAGTLNFQKARSHLIEAAEQSCRLTLPTLDPLVALPKLLSSWPQDRILLFGDETLSSPPLTSLQWQSDKKYAFLIGPEGGFTRQELEMLGSLPEGKGVTLSSQILRAETAAIVGVSYLQLQSLGKELKQSFSNAD